MQFGCHLTCVCSQCIWGTAGPVRCLQEATRQLEENAAAIAALKAAHAALSDAHAACPEALEAARAAAASSAAALEVLQGEAAVTAEAREQADLERHALRERLAEVERECCAAAGALASARADVEALRAEADRREATQQQLDAAARQLADLRQAVDERSRQCAAAHAECEAARADADRHKAALSKLQARPGLRLRAARCIELHISVWPCGAPVDSPYMTDLLAATGRCRRARHRTPGRGSCATHVASSARSERKRRS